MVPALNEEPYLTDKRGMDTSLGKASDSKLSYAQYPTGQTLSSHCEILKSPVPFLFQFMYVLDRAQRLPLPC